MGETRSKDNNENLMIQLQYASFPYLCLYPFIVYRSRLLAIGKLDTKVFFE